MERNRKPWGCKLKTSIDLSLPPDRFDSEDGSIISCSPGAERRRKKKKRKEVLDREMSLVNSPSDVLIIASVTCGCRN